MSNYKDELRYTINKIAEIMTYENFKFYADIYGQVYEEIDEVATNIEVLSGTLDKQIRNLYKTITSINDGGGGQNKLLDDINTVLNSNFTIGDFKDDLSGLKASLVLLYQNQSSDIPKALLGNVVNITNDEYPLNFYTHQSSAIDTEIKLDYLYNNLLKKYPEDLVTYLHTEISSRFSKHSLGIDAIKNDTIRAGIKSNIAHNIDLWNDAVANFKPIYNESTRVDQLLIDFVNNSTNYDIKSEINYTQSKANCFLSVVNFSDDAIKQILAHDGNYTEHSIEETLSSFLVDFDMISNQCHNSYKLNTILDDFLYKNYLAKTGLFFLTILRYNTLQESTNSFFDNIVPEVFTSSEFKDKLIITSNKIKYITHLFELGEGLFKEAEKTREEGVLNKELMHTLYSQYIDQEQVYLPSLSSNSTLNPSFFRELGYLGTKVAETYNEFLP
jgi:hypothetical protein